MDGLLFALTFVGAVGAGLVAGVFFAFSSFVMPGLGRLPAPAAVSAMQEINVTAVTPVFMAAFMGTAALSVVLGVWGALTLDESHAPRLLVAAIAYVAGTFALTAIYHVPRNNALNAVDVTQRGVGATWDTFYRGWVSWNHVRALAATGALAAYIAALLEM